MIPLPALGIQPAQPVDLVGQVAKVRQLQAMGQEQQIHAQTLQSNALDLQMKQRDLQDQQTVMQVLGKHQGDLDAALPDLAGSVSAKTFIGLDKYNRDRKKEALEIDEKTRNANLAVNGQKLGLIEQAQDLAAKDPQGYQQAFPQIAAQMISLDPRLKGKIDPNQPVPPEMLDRFKLGLMTDSVYDVKVKAQQAAAEESRKAAMAPSQLAASQADATIKQNQAAAGGTSDVDKYISNYLKSHDLPNTAANWAVAHKAYTDETKTQPGVMRMEALGQLREYPVINKQTGELEMRNATEINQSKGNFAPAGEGAKAMGKTALIEDIRGNIGQVRASLQNEKMPEFSAAQRAHIAVAVGGPQPSTALSAAFRGGVLGNLTEEQQGYLINLAQLKENAMAMRSVLGAGQGSEDMRAAINATIPGPNTPSKAYGLQQLDKFEAVLNRLGRGVPGMPLKPASGQQPQQAAPAAGGFSWDKMPEHK